jgi:hypothetical protein
MLLAFGVTTGRSFACRRRLQSYDGIQYVS